MSELFDRPLSISIETADGITVMSLIGELDAATTEDLQTHLRGLGAGPIRLVIDLSKLAFIDSSGLNALASGARALEDNGSSMVLAAASAHVANVFDIVQLRSQVPTEATVDDARRMLANRATDMEAAS